MCDSTTPTFIHELNLEVNSSDAKELLTRFSIAGYLYNGCLDHCLDLIDLIKQSKDFQKAKGKSNKGKVIKGLQEKYNFSEYALHDYAKHMVKAGKFDSHLDSLTVQKIASRAYLAAWRYFLAQGGKPRFKSFGRLRSLEGKTNRSGLRFKDGYLYWNIKKGKRLKLKVKYDHKDKYGIEAHALNCEVKYCRLLFRDIKGKRVWYLQLILEGRPKVKNKPNEGIVGIDVGPSTIAVSSDKEALLEPFCMEQEKEIKKLERKMDRSRRANNPGNYNKDKTVKKKTKYWKRSEKYIKLQKLRKEEYRKLKETRKKLQSRLVNKLLTYGNIFRLEKLSYKGFQRRYGKSINKRAPGLFISILRRKAESAGGKVEEFSTYKTKLSQTCHCGKQKKKKLSERWHKCDCGIKAQRDLYSAYLARFVNEDNLDTTQAKKAWAVEESLQGRAVSRINQLANGKNRLLSLGLTKKLETEPVAR